MTDDSTGPVVRTQRGLTVDSRAISWVATRSGGPGGQHANTSDTAVTVTIDVVAAGLGAAVTARVLEVAGASVIATSSASRSQWRNRQAALAAALERLDTAATPPPPPRRRTRPTRGSTERRLAGKRLTGDRKRERQRPSGDD